MNGKEEGVRRTMVKEGEEEEGEGENDEPLGVEAAGELVNAQGNYAGLAKITPCKIVIPP